jgi:Ribose/xylose/arabinose/galactoside ABC-type transport systems, permease components
MKIRGKNAGPATAAFCLKTLKSLALPAAIYVFFKLLRPEEFGSAGALFIILQQAMVSLVISLGICCTMAIGIWDFSPGAIVTMAALVGGAYCSRYGFGAMVGAGLIAGAVFGIVDAAVYTALKIPSVVVTIGFLLVYESVGTVYEGGKGFAIAPEQAILGMPPWIFVAALAMTAAMYVIYNKTSFGFHVKALGNGEAIARNAGVNPAKVKFIAFALAGLYFGVAGVLSLSYGQAIAPQKNMGTMSITFDAMIAVFIGFSLSRFCNPIVGILIGNFCMKLISAGLVAISVNGTLQKVIVGMFLLVFICFSQVRERLSAGNASRRIPSAPLAAAGK